MPPTQAPSAYTAGAVQVRNEKGEVSMQKVKVSRYVAGKRPEYAPSDSSDDEDVELQRSDDDESSDDEKPDQRRAESDDDVKPQTSSGFTEREMNDPRLRRLIRHRVHESSDEEDEEDDVRQRRSPSESPPSDSETTEQRRIAIPEVISSRPVAQPSTALERMKISSKEGLSSSDEDGDEDTARERLRRRLRERARVEASAAAAPAIASRARREAAETAEHEPVSDSDEDDSDSDESGSEDDTKPRLKPVFVKKRDRVTVDDEEKRERVEEEREKKVAEERRKESLRIVESQVKSEIAEEQRTELTKVKSSDAPMPPGLAEALADPDIKGALPIIDDHADEEEEYEAWKLRELQRIKRNREERDALNQEREEIERLRQMTDEERRRELEKNPRVVTNYAPKGKMKFLQKYYHRGVYYLDKDNDVFKRDFMEPTMDDQMDKSLLPKVMQVKDFGKAGRTKWTHLSAEDTTQFDAAWAEPSMLNARFHAGRGGGTRQTFHKPSSKRKRQ